jgi:hypothetical protein
MFSCLQLTPSFIINLHFLQPSFSRTLHYGWHYLSSLIHISFYFSAFIFKASFFCCMLYTNCPRFPRPAIFSTSFVYVLFLLTIYISYVSLKNSSLLADAPAVNYKTSTASDQTANNGKNLYRRFLNSEDSD